MLCAVGAGAQSSAPICASPGRECQRRVDEGHWAHVCGRGSGHEEAGGGGLEVQRMGRYVLN